MTHFQNPKTDSFASLRVAAALKPEVPSGGEPALVRKARLSVYFNGVICNGSLKGFLPLQDLRHSQSGKAAEPSIYFFISENGRGDELSNSNLHWTSTMVGAVVENTLTSLLVL